MEDEECLPENSSLNLYLQNLGYTDFSVTKATQREPPIFRFEVSKSNTNPVETVDEDIVDQISIIISTQMLFEEDVSKVEKLLLNFRIVKNGMLKSMFKDLFGVAVIFLGLCLFWVIGYYAFFIVSSFYAFTAADYLCRKHFNRRRLKKLTSILQANFLLLRKAVKFIEENRLLEASFSCPNNSAEFKEGFDFYNNFKSDFLLSVTEMINILTESTQKLINKIPLYNYIENPEYYLCYNFNKNYESINMSNLYQIYLLVQSEFLQRLILSLIPNIKLSTNDGVHELNKILTETCVSLLKFKSRLNKKFKFLFLNGIYSSKSEIQFKLHSNNNSSSTYSNEFLFNIHETSKTFQRLLLQCRILEEKIMPDKIPEFVEQELIKIQHSLSACQRNITDSLILFKKANFVRDDSYARAEVKVQDEKEVESPVQKLNKVVVGYSDLDPKIEDEIFEAYFNNEISVPNLPDVNLWELEERLEKKKKKEMCKNIMNELKIKLKEKARYWKRRERELLKKKGLGDMNEYTEETETSDEEKEVDDDSDVQKLHESPQIFERSESNTATRYKNMVDYCPVGKSQEPLECSKTYQNSQESCTVGNFFELEVSDEKNTLNLSNESNCEESTQNFNKDFLNDLNLARQKIFNSCDVVEEELFYASGEDSSSEENVHVNQLIS